MLKEIAKTITTFIFAFLLLSTTALASTPDSVISVPVSAIYTKGSFSFVVAEEGSLGLNTTVETSNNTLQAEFVDAQSEELLEFGSDVVVTAYLTPIDVSIIKDKASILDPSSKLKKEAFDITLFKQIGNTSEEVTETSQKIRFRISAPSDLNKDKANESKMLTIHVAGGVEEVMEIPVAYEGESDTIIFEVDRFSSFVLMYPTKENVTPTPDPAPAPSSQKEEKNKERKEAKQEQAPVFYPPYNLISINNNYYPTATNSSSTASEPEDTSSNTSSQSSVAADPQDEPSVVGDFQTGDSVSILVSLILFGIGLVVLTVLIVVQQCEKKNKKQ